MGARSSEPVVTPCSPVAICLAELNGNIVHVNPRVCVLLGLPYKELLSFDLAGTVARATGVDVSDALARLADGRSEVERVLGRVTRPGHRANELLLTLSRTSAGDGSPRVVLQVQDLDDRATAGDRTRAATHEPLTGLPNREYFMERLEQALSRVGHAVTAVMFVDLDDFKDVNDGHGHKAGDHVIIATAQRLVGALRPFDTVTRLGGDEFAVICEGLDSEAAATRVAHRLLDAVCAPIVFGSDELLITSSVGVAIVTPDTRSADDLLHEADSAMYRAKARGKNQVEVFDDALRRTAVHRASTEVLLRQGLRENLFRLHYQPIFELATGNLAAVEALLRLDRPGTGLLSPPRFIDVAEHSGLIVPIGAWALREACRQLVQWRSDADVPASAHVAVNLSARQVSRSDLVTAVSDALHATGLEPTALVLELTESILMELDSAHVQQLEMLRDLGVTLAIDDFGTGYTSLAYLKRLPVSILKIDQSFVGGLLNSEADRGITTSVVELGHALGLTVIAEGVEDADQLDALWVLGCDQVQGFHLGRPVPPTSVPPSTTDWGESLADAVAAG